MFGFNAGLILFTSWDTALRFTLFNDCGVRPIIVFGNFFKKWFDSCTESSLLWHFRYFANIERNRLDSKPIFLIYNILNSFLTNPNNFTLIKVNIIEYAITPNFACIDFPFIHDSILKEYHAILIKCTIFEIACINLTTGINNAKSMWSLLLIRITIILKFIINFY